MTAQAIIRASGITWHRADRIPTLVLITGAAVIALHRGFFSMETITRIMPTLSQSDSVTGMFIAAFVLMGLLPAMLAVTVLREPLRNFGVQLGDWRFGIKAVAILLPVITVTALWPGAHNPEMRAWFPLDHSAAASINLFVGYQALRLVVFYIAWEFFFRGFMLFGMKQSVGDWVAICIQTIPSCLWHIGMPAGELFSSIAGGVLFGFLALRTRSIIWPLVLHAGIGIVTDALIVYS